MGHLQLFHKPVVTICTAIVISERQQRDRVQRIDERKSNSRRNRSRNYKNLLLPYSYFELLL